MNRLAPIIVIATAIALLGISSCKVNIDLSEPPWKFPFLFPLIPVAISTMFFTAFILALVITVLIIRRGMPAEVAPLTTDGKPKLVRIIQRRSLGGVCAGFAYVLGWPIWLMRVTIVGFTLLVFPVGILIYIILWVAMPRSNELPPDFENRTNRF